MTKSSECEFLSVKQAAARWNVSKTFIRRAIAAGDLQAGRFGRIIRIPLPEIYRFEKAAIGNENVTA